MMKLAWLCYPHWVDKEDKGRGKVKWQRETK
jgi:hypothetical protein